MQRRHWSKVMGSDEFLAQGYSSGDTVNKLQQTDPVETLEMIARERIWDR